MCCLHLTNSTYGPKRGSRVHLQVNRHSQDQVPTHCQTNQLLPRPVHNPGPNGMFSQTGPTPASCHDIQNGAQVEHSVEPCRMHQHIRCVGIRHASKHHSILSAWSQGHILHAHSLGIAGQVGKAATCRQKHTTARTPAYTSTDFASLLVSPMLGLLGAWGMALASDQRGI